MSMLSAQCDELRKWADQLSERENEFGVVVRALVASLREAADTIWELRCRLVDAEDHVRKSGELCKLCEREAENAKLRELADYMTPIAWYAASERERDRMRELGIEVDG